MDLDRRLALAAAAALLASLAGRPRRALGAERSADPLNYQEVVADLRPGDHLRLAPGTYQEGLDLGRLHGRPDQPIVIEGPADGSARFLGQSGRNTVELREVSHLELRHLTLDGLNTPGIDGVKAQAVTHHITLANLVIVNHAAHQQNVGISTKAPAWAWIIRDNVVRNVGTGLYLGDSDGSAPFIQGLIEGNFIADTIGYGLQIKHQAARPAVPRMPNQPGSTIIRRNIISKARQPRRGFQGPRPNLLVGHLPPSGAGADDLYEIYGNLLYQNLVNEPLFQGEGNLALHDNLLVNHHGQGAWIQPHNDRPRKVAVFHNTVVARDLGLRLLGSDPAFRQVVTRNAVFAAQPFEGGEQWDNLAADYASAVLHLRAPFAGQDDLDLRPRPGRLRAPAEELTLLTAFRDANRDFAGNRRDGSYLGAYAGPAVERHHRRPSSSAL